MKKEIRQIKDGIVQVTTADERWYVKEVKDKKTGLPEIKYVPSVTWIKSYYYTSPFLVRWIADKGMTEAEMIKNEAGIKGDKIHKATEDIDKGLEIKYDDKYINRTTGFEEELSTEEYEAILSYRDYIDKEQPELIASEMTVFNKEDSEEEYAGTLDRIFGIYNDGVRQIYIVDIKTSKSIYKDMALQLSAYSNADIDYKKLGITDKEWESRKLLILQIGYTRNKNGYKATEIEDKYYLFASTYKVWQEENPDSKPKQRDLPLSIKSEFRTKK